MDLASGWTVYTWEDGARAVLHRDPRGRAVIEVRPGSRPGIEGSLGRVLLAPEDHPDGRWIRLLEAPAPLVEACRPRRPGDRPSPAAIHLRGQLLGLALDLLPEVERVALSGAGIELRAPLAVEDEAFDPLPLPPEDLTERVVADPFHRLLSDRPAEGLLHHARGLFVSEGCRPLIELARTGPLAFVHHARVTHSGDRVEVRWRTPWSHGVDRSLEARVRTFTGRWLTSCFEEEPDLRALERDLLEALLEAEGPVLPTSRVPEWFEVNVIFGSVVAHPAAHDLLAGLRERVPEVRWRLHPLGWLAGDLGLSQGRGEDLSALELVPVLQGDLLLGWRLACRSSFGRAFAAAEPRLLGADRDPSLLALAVREALAAGAAAVGASVVQLLVDAAQPGDSSCEWT